MSCFASLRDRGSEKSSASRSIKVFPADGVRCRLGVFQSHRPLLHPVGVMRRRLDRVAIAVTSQGQTVAEFLQQDLFKAPQIGLAHPAARVAGQPGEHCRITSEKAVMRILARQQMHQQFVEVIAAKQGLTRQQGVAALPFRFHQGQDFALAGPADFQRLKGHHQPANRRAWAARASCQQAPCARNRGKTLRR